MSKILLLILAAIAAWLLIKRLRAKRSAADAQASAAAGRASEQMVNCSVCGVYLPQQEAIAEGDKFFCCAEHRRGAG